MNNTLNENALEVSFIVSSCQLIQLTNLNKCTCPPINHPFHFLGHLIISNITINRNLQLKSNYIFVYWGGTYTDNNTHSHHLFLFVELKSNFYRLTGIKQWTSGTNFIQIWSCIRRISALKYAVFKTTFPVFIFLSLYFIFLSTMFSNCNIVNLLSQVIQLDYNKEDENPINRVYFYRKKQHNKGRKIRTYEVLTPLCCSSNQPFQKLSTYQKNIFQNN